MAGTPKNELNKIQKEMDCDNNEVAQDGEESAVSLLPGGRLSGEVDGAAQTCYKRVKIIIYGIIYSVYSTPIGMKTEV